MTEAPSAKQVVFDLKLRFRKGSIGASVPVPDREMRLADLLPVLQAVQDAVTLGVVKDVEGDGGRISCRAGCGACCRQPVPIGESEAIRLAELVERMPAARQQEIRARFAEALRKLDEHGLLDAVRGFSKLDPAERMRLGRSYFRLWIACPFLEDESCGIYEDRPLRCREFLVTSPPENCASDDPGNVERPAPAPGPWPLVYRFEDGRGEDEPRWLPLVLALEFAEARAANPLPTYRAPEVFQRLLDRIAGGEPDPDTPDTGGDARP